MFVWPYRFTSIRCGHNFTYFVMSLLLLFSWISQTDVVVIIDDDDDGGGDGAAAAAIMTY